MQNSSEQFIIAWSHTSIAKHMYQYIEKTVFYDAYDSAKLHLGMCYG